jgi:hypothetical protein
MTRAISLLAAAAACACASSTATWEMNTFADFSRGRFAALSLSRDGRMALGPRLDTLYSTEQPSVWSVAEAPDGTLYAGTGHRGRVFRIEARGGKGSLLWTAPEPEIFAVAAGPDGAVYAGTSPDGAVYRIEGGKATVYFKPEARYIWALAFDSSGALYVGTGDNGRIWRVSRAGTGEVWYESGQQHITALAVDSHGRLLAGSEPNGLLYRISGKNQAFVLYDSTLPEIRTISVAADGAVYAAALGGSIAQRTSASTGAAQTSSTTPQVSAPATSITVTDEGAGASAQGGGIEIRPKPPGGDNAKTQVTATITPGTTLYTAPPAELAGVEKSALYRINLDNTVETLWSSREENLYDLLLAANSEVVFATDTQGRIYRLTPDRRLTLLVQTNAGETTRLLPSGDSLVAATSTSGKVLRIGGGLATEGAYESPVHDAGSVAKWGQVSWRGQRSSGGRLVFRTRSGNSGRPDNTWSPWSEPVADPAGSAMTSPNARFIQWRAEFTGNGSDSPSITGVTLSYLPQNNPPVLHSINVMTQIVPAGASTKAASASATTSTAFSVTVTDSTDTASAPAQTVSRGLAQQIQVTWQADDPDGDKLSYSVFFRGEDETQWKPLKTNIAENIVTLEGDVLADGKYFFRVVASDRPANPAASARESEMVSPPVSFDNTPPVVRASGRREGTRVVVEAEASDPSSSLRRAEYSLDALAWVPLDSLDGVVDGQQERFRLELPTVTAGEHVIVIRVFDASNNSGLAKIVIPPATNGQ